MTAMRANDSSCSSLAASSCFLAAQKTPSNAGIGIVSGIPLTLIVTLAPLVFTCEMNVSINSKIPARRRLVGCPASEEAGVEGDAFAGVVVSVGLVG